jgi:cation diffusion facilitator CzcD-associated flavoprotein CzcO
MSARESMLSAVASDVVGPEALATAWLLCFTSALQSRDAQAAADLFRPDGSWRDLLAVAGQLRTSGDPRRIADLLHASWSGAPRRTWQFDRVTRVDRVARYGADLIEAFFEFTTHVGAGIGIVRFRADDLADINPAAGAAPSAWVLFTALQTLAGDDSAAPVPTAAPPARSDDPTVLVVGAGQHGLSIAARLTACGISTLVLERTRRVGDCWRKRYASLKLHNDTRANHLPYLPFPPIWEPYTPKDKLANWFEFYADALDLDVWTGTPFTGAAFDAEHGRWEVTVEHGGAPTTLRPRHIVMATGVSGIPLVPHLEGIERFAGTVTHTSDYTDGAPYAGRRVLVVGSGSSGHDIAQDLDRHGAASIAMMQRSPTTIISLEPGCRAMYSLYTSGLPLDEADLIHASGNYALAKQWLPAFNRSVGEMDAKLLAGLHKAGFITDLGEEDLGILFKYRRRGGGYYIDIGCSQLIIDGRVEIVQARDFATFTEGGIRLTDGTTRDLDDVVLATGYAGIQAGVRKLFGPEVADRVGPVWGLDAEGELNNIARQTPQDGLWFLAGGFPEARIYSAYLALQIRAAEAGLAL